MGQVLLAPLDFSHRGQYLHARGTLARWRSLGVVPIVNENDAVADEEIRFGDNDRLAALVANLVGASHLVLLTDTEGLLDGRPPSRSPRRRSSRRSPRSTPACWKPGRGEPLGGGQRRHGLQAGGGADGHLVGRHHGDRPGARAQPLAPGARGRAGFGHDFHPRDERLSARKAWIAFAVASRGVLTINEGALQALEDDGRSLLRVGVEPPTATSQRATPSKSWALTARWSRRGSSRVGAEGSDEVEDVVVHRDDLVLLHVGPEVASITLKP